MIEYGTKSPEKTSETCSRGSRFLVTPLRLENSQNVKMTTEVIASTFREFSKGRNVTSRSKSLRSCGYYRKPERVRYRCCGRDRYKTSLCATRMTSDYGPATSASSEGGRLCSKIDHQCLGLTRAPAFHLFTVTSSFVYTVCFFNRERSYDLRPRFVTFSSFKAQNYD
jgi:hypothetical protein